MIARLFDICDPLGILLAIRRRRDCSGRNLKNHIAESLSRAVEGPAR